MSNGRPPLRVLIVTHSLSGGGAERFASNLARHLDRRRFAPRIAAATPAESYGVPADVPVTLLGYRGAANLPATVLRLRALMKRDPPDLVLSNVLSTNCLTGAALWGWSGAPPWVARVGNAPGEREPRLQRLWARRVYPKARVVVANAEEMAQALAESYPEVAARVTSLPNPTDFAEIDRLAEAAPESGDPPAGFPGARSAPSVSASGFACGAASRLREPPGNPAYPLLVWAGRMTPQKRPELMLEAFAQVRRQVDAQLWMLGDGPLLPMIRGQIERLGLASAVTLHGFCQNPFPLMRQADLFVLTSDFEGLPNALIEAQGLGVPAVATRCPFGPAEIVAEGETGRLVPPGDAEALAAAILATLSDERHCAGMGEAARRRARELFDLPRVLPRWEALLEAHAETAGRA